MTEQLGRYHLEEVIGVGSFATVHRALDPRLEDTVVVKILAENHSLNPEIRERFIAEGRALRRVSSPHVVTVHDLAESERQQPYLVLEHADRGTLAERVGRLRQKGWRAGPEDVRVLAHQLATAVEALHTARLVHRDLSPSNVLLTSGAVTPEGDEEFAGARLIGEDEHLVVADLGMCKDLAVSSGLTVAGGTSGFRPPEMDAGPAVIDTRADLWALSSLVSWVRRGADPHPALDRALERSLAVDPADRHPDVRAWLADIEAAVAPEPEDVAPESREPREPRESTDVADGPARPAPRRAGWRGRALVAALLAVLLVLGGWALGRSGGPDETTDTARIAIEGPAEIDVGESATFTVRHSGVQSWVWSLPGGGYVTDRETVTLTPSGAGSAELQVSGRDEQGRELHSTLRLRVRD